MVFFHLNARLTVSLDFILLPFENTLWDFLLVFSTVALIGMHLFVRVLRSRASVRDEWSWSNSVMALLGSFFNQGHPKVRKTFIDPLRLLIAHWSLFAIVISTAYTSVLFKLYMHLPKEKVPTTFQELEASDYEIGMAFYGGALYKFFENTHHRSQEAQIFNRAQKMKPPSCWKAATKTNFACVTFDLDVLFFVNTKPQTERPTVSVGAKKFQMIDSVVISKGSVLKESLESVFGRLNNGGFRLYWLERTFEDLRYEAKLKSNTKQNRHTLPSSENRSLSMKHLGRLALAFEMVIVGSVIALVAECASSLCKHIDCRNVRVKPRNYKPTMKTRTRWM